MDKLFIEKYMPRFNNALHYRVMDVSTVKELCRGWYPDLFAKMEKKKNPHRALGDILESIEELKYYKKTIFK
jgi:oligoribonuclease